MKSIAGITMIKLSIQLQYLSTAAASRVFKSWVVTSLELAVTRNPTVTFSLCGNINKISIYLLPSHTAYNIFITALFDYWKLNTVFPNISRRSVWSCRKPPTGLSKLPTRDDCCSFLVIKLIACLLLITCSVILSNFR